MSEIITAQRKYKEIRKRAFANFIDIRLFHFFIQDPSIVAPGIDELIGLVVQKELYDLYARCCQMISSKNVPGHSHIKIGEVDKLYKHWYHYNEQQIPVLEKVFQEKFFLSEEAFINFYGFDKTERRCMYCHISEEEIKSLGEHGLIKTKRYLTRGKLMEVDRMDPFLPYTEDNMVLCCYWCNNAKTDEFSVSEFREVGIAMSKIWAERLGEIKP